MLKLCQAGSIIAAFAAVSRSKMPMMRTRLVSLKNAMKVLTSGGMTWRRACGRMMSPVPLPIGEAEGLGAFGLTFRHGLQSGTHDFGQVGSGEEDDGDLRAQELIDVETIGHEQRKHDARHEQEADQRHATNEFDIEHAKSLDGG